MAISTTTILVSITCIFFMSTIFASTYAIVIVQDDLERENYINIFYITLTVFLTLCFATCLTYYTENPLPTVNQVRALATGAPVPPAQQSQQQQQQQQVKPTAPPQGK